MLPIDERQREMNAHQKAALATMLLLGGSELTTSDVARLTGLTWEGAEFMMEMISGICPIRKVQEKWKWME